MPVRQRIREQIAAASVIAVGAGLSAIAYGYPQGSMFRPGPGFFPFYIGLLLVLLGVMVALENRRMPMDDSDENQPSGMRPVVAISVAMVVLALLLERLGFVPAMVAMFVCIGFAERRTSWLPLLGVCLFMAIFGTALFIWGLSVPISAFGAS
ncbi:MAG: tripartite tricarboxylate transporter TctB family protein [Rhizobiaceae bacterium]|nr:tripartite tricarboxylate transporter TctB family protein [Rhizobiaceae bacterium]